MAAKKSRKSLAAKPGPAARPTPAEKPAPAVTTVADAVGAAVAGDEKDCPPFRRLRVYSFDPSLDTQMETAVVNRVTVQVPWEKLSAGPVGEYVEVIDFDPVSGCFYEPVNLNRAYVLAEQGLAPSEGSPQFHQQMVYAVAMRTVETFEQALGRVALWAPRVLRRDDGTEGEEFVRRLRIYPHALRVANAYYSPQKKALLFGYFPAAAVRPGQHMPRGIVFTCLSHDIVAHETTHALLDGMNRRYLNPTNPDVLAFHEAFADIVALFQHFSLPEVLRHQIALTRGDLASQNMLGQLAQQFGETTGRYGALRDALGQVNRETGAWEPKRPDPSELERVFTPHDRGAILVAAVFDAFLSIYKSRITDLVRIATSGTGVLPSGALHPDLVNRLAGEAARSARHVLNMCVRALDYCPPVDLTFGEYLRAIITADYELVRDDDRHYRVAFIEAFRRRGIYPRDIRTLSEGSLRWDDPAVFLPAETPLPPFREAVRALVKSWDATGDRRAIFEQLAHSRAHMREWLPELLSRPEMETLRRGLGLDLTPRPGPDGRTQPAELDVTGLRPARRIGPDGQHLIDLIIEITQRRWETLPPAEGGDAAAAGSAGAAVPPRGFWFHGGSTVIFDLQSHEVRYCITKDINSQSRLERHRQFLAGGSLPSLQATYFGKMESEEDGEVFAFLHGGEEEVE